MRSFSLSLSKAILQDDVGYVSRKSSILLHNFFAYIENDMDKSLFPRVSNFKASAV